jgi:addiction module HigA family antidote
MGNSTGLNFKPPHPGEYIREDILPNLGMTLTQLANRLGVSRQTLSEVVNERRGISTEMAIRLGRAFGNGARFWLALQMQHELWLEEEAFSAHVPPIEWRDGHNAVA